ncbi:MAG: hypothetical protein ACJATU_000683, partial [Rickettsiales bacterium]
MRKFVALIALAIILAPTHSIARENSGKLVFRKKFEKITASFASDYRYSQVGLDHRHYDFGLKIPFWESWSTSINYRLVYKFKDKNNKWKQEKRPHISLQKVFDYKFIKIELRTRQEYRYKADDTESSRNRSRIMIKSNKKILHLKPFLGNEFFYDLDKKKYNKNRLIGGVSFPKSKFGNYSLYYRHFTYLDKQDNWSSDYGFVFK